jgi:hypothetical protein
VVGDKTVYQYRSFEPGFDPCYISLDNTLKQNRQVVRFQVILSCFQAQFASQSSRGSGAQIVAAGRPTAGGEASSGWLAGVTTPRAADSNVGGRDKIAYGSSTSLNSGITLHHLISFIVKLLPLPPFRRTTSKLQYYS